MSQWEADSSGRGYSLYDGTRLIGRVDAAHPPTTGTDSVQSAQTHSEAQWGCAPIMNQRQSVQQFIKSGQQIKVLLDAAQDPKRNVADVVMGMSWDAAVWPEGALPQTVGRFVELGQAMAAAEKWWAHWNRDLPGGLSR